MNFSHRVPSPKAGSALITTLLVIVVLSIISVAFLQSMSIEKQTSRSYLNRYKAELAADTAQNVAIQQLCKLMVDNPYHAIGYQYPSGTSAAIPGATPPPIVYPVLYGSTSPHASPTPTYSYLISIPKSGEEKTTPTSDPTELPADPSSLDDKNSVAINYKRSNDPSGWMGSPVDSEGQTIYRECRALWIYVLQDPSKAHQPDPSQSGYNPYISRYAYWVEDETSKVDLLLGGNSSGPGGAFLPPKLENLADPDNSEYKDAIAWEPADLDIGALPIKDGKPLDTGDSSTNQKLVNDLRTFATFPKDARVLGQVDSFDKSEPPARFYTTVGSTSNELAGNGRRRVNINALVHDESVNHMIIGSDIDDIAYAIAGRHVIDQSSRSQDGLFSDAQDVDKSDPNSSALLPKFGDRFWPSTVTEGDFSDPSLFAKKDQIYLVKLAVNIRDYIDLDSYPTYVSDSGVAIAGDNNLFSHPDSEPEPGTYPNLSTDGPMPWAIGKEAIPYVLKGSFNFSYASSTLTVSEIISFYNPSTKDYQAPSGTYFKCFNRFKWVSGGLGNKQPKPYSIDLSGRIFPAGKVVIIDTASESQIIPSDANQLKDSNHYAPALNGTYDAETKVFLANSQFGYLGGFAAVTLVSPLPNMYAMGDPPLKSPKSTFPTNMQGNSGDALSASRTGDARSTEEPLTFNHTIGSNAIQDQARFYNDDSANMAYPFSKFILPQKWPDYNGQFPESTTATATTRYAVIRDGPMASVGEMGNIYDPSRVKGAGIFLDFARGGGRTLRVGQPDDLLKKDDVRLLNTPAPPEIRNYLDAIKAAAAEPRFSDGWKQSAWRLTDIFGVILSNSTTATLQGKVDRTTKLVPPQASGKLNINSVMRDNGATLRTLLRGFKYLAGTNSSGSPYTDASLSDAALSDTEIDKIVTAVKTYIVKKGPMIERGELSQLVNSVGNTPLFANDTLGGKQMSTTQDRGREEIFRRLIEMLTTRSASFTVYAVGQSLRDTTGTKQPVVLSTATKAITYRLDPTISGKTGSEIPDSAPLDAVTEFVATPLYVHP